MANKRFFITGSSDRLTRPCPFDRRPEADGAISGITVMVGSNSCQKCSDHVAQTTKWVVCRCNLPLVIRTLNIEVTHDS